MDRKTAQEIIEKTQADYNRMAAEFSRTRGGMPEDLRALGQYIVTGEKALDLGCGNGRLSALFAAADYVGADASEELVRIARAKFPDKEFVAVEPLGMPFAEATFDAVFSLAVIHHIPSGPARGEFLAEIRRVLKPGGRLVLTAWYLWADPKKVIQLAKQALLKVVGRSRLDFADIWLPFSSSQGEILARRYYHAFSAAGLKRMIAGQGFAIEEARLVRRGANKNLQIVARARR